MKQFFKFTFASMLGFFLASMLIFFVSIGIMMSMISLTKKEVVNVPEKTILMLNLNQQIQDRASDNPMNYFNMNGLSNAKPLGLNEIINNIKKAGNDPNISGIYMELSDLSAGFSSIEEIRNSLIEFKASKKFIIAYSEVFTQKSYYLASVADKIYLNPTGSMEFKGLVSQVMFFKGLLDKVHVQAQVIRHGKFKSAVEPYIQDKMSDANKEQTLTFVTGIWNHILDGISKTRNITKDELTAIAIAYKLQTPQDAVQFKFIDKLMYKDEVLDELKNLVKVTDVKDLNIMKLGKYANAPEIGTTTGKDKIAVIYAGGNIISGEGDEESIGSERISKTIRKARLDSKVKAVVLRVNSPGGSALASDVIWREMLLTKKVKPVVVSMGDVAASGGYYISCAADKIFAYPTTITGSIGVFGIIPNTKELFNKSLGITFDEVKTNPYADYIPTTRPMNDAERQIITRDVENIYTTFITHVAEGRKLTIAQVDSIGQGRVWCGTDAKKIGLVDEYGGLQDAIKEAAKLAKTTDYRTWELPAQKDALTMIMEAFNSDNASRMLTKEFGTAYPYFQYLNQMRNMQGVQALMPFQYIIK